MGYYNGYAGYYKGNEDEYENLTMSPWVEDVMEAIEASNLESPKKIELKEMLITASYNQKEDVKSVFEALLNVKEDTNAMQDISVCKVVQEALSREEKLIKVL